MSEAKSIKKEMTINFSKDCEQKKHIIFFIYINAESGSHLFLQVL